MSRNRWKQNNYQSESNRGTAHQMEWNQRVLDVNHEKLEIQIDRSKVGKLIGARGSKIKELEKNSGAKIYIVRSTMMETVPVNLIGTAKSCQSAKNLIDDLLSEHTHCSNPPGRKFVKESPMEAQDAPQLYQQPPQELEPFTEIDWQKAKEEHQRYQVERLKSLKPMIKNFYKEDPVVAGMTEEEVASIRRRNNNIECRRVFEAEASDSSLDAFKVPNPVESFEQAFREYPDILEEIRKQGFESPSPIQCQAWPILLSGKDLIGIAQTGTGKTLAFLLPALIHIDGQPEPLENRGGPNVIVLAPTRELALQIKSEVDKYTYKDIKAVCIYGGGSRQDQVDICREGVQILIATPGRLNDLIMSGIVNMKAVTYLVLDEADRMLDMGFQPQIRNALAGVRPDRQTVMTSATWPEEVRRLAKSYMQDPIQVFVGSLDLTAVHSVHQEVHLVKHEKKSQMLYDFFKSMAADDKVIVFFGRKSTVDHWASTLALKDVICQSIHGDREQYDREQALDDLRKGEVRILLATDVASRGLDIEDITHVFNYDFPSNIEDYVHRVGRTGRAGRTGHSISLVTRQDWANAKKLIEILEEAGQAIPEGLYKMSESFENRDIEKDRERKGRRDGFGGGGARSGGGRRGGSYW